MSVELLSYLEELGTVYDTLDIELSEYWSATSYTESPVPVVHTSYAEETRYGE